MGKKAAKRAEVIEHLKMIQAVITRMNGNSFMLKRWSIVLLAALFLYLRIHGEKLSSCVFVLAFVLILTLGLLDMYYLWQERGYRNLHDEVAGKSETDFDMRASNAGNPYFRTLTSWSVWPLYMAELLILIGLFLVQK